MSVVKRRIYVIQRSLTALTVPVPAFTVKSCVQEEEEENLIYVTINPRYLVYNLAVHYVTSLSVTSLSIIMLMIAIQYTHAEVFSSFLLCTVRLQAYTNRTPNAHAHVHETYQ